MINFRRIQQFFRDRPEDNRKLVEFEGNVQDAFTQTSGLFLERLKFVRDPFLAGPIRGILGEVYDCRAVLELQLPAPIESDTGRMVGLLPSANVTVRPLAGLVANAASLVVAATNTLVLIVSDGRNYWRVS